MPVILQTVWHTLGIVSTFNSIVSMLDWLSIKLDLKRTKNWLLIETTESQLDQNVRPALKGYVYEYRCLSVSYIPNVTLTYIEKGMYFAWWRH